MVFYSTVSVDQIDGYNKATGTISVDHGQATYQTQSNVVEDSVKLGRNYTILCKEHVRLCTILFDLAGIQDLAGLGFSGAYFVLLRQ